MIPYHSRIVAHGAFSLARAKTSYQHLSAPTTAYLRLSKCDFSHEERIIRRNVGVPASILA